jgi:hypothetical protein
MNSNSGSNNTAPTPVFRDARYTGTPWLVNMRFTLNYSSSTDDTYIMLYVDFYRSDDVEHLSVRDMYSRPQGTRAYVHTPCAISLPQNRPCVYIAEKYIPTTYLSAKAYAYTLLTRKAAY